MYEYQRRKGSFTYIMETRQRRQPDINDFYMYIMTDDTYFALFPTQAITKSTKHHDICIVGHIFMCNICIIIIYV